MSFRLADSLSQIALFKLHEVNFLKYKVLCYNIFVPYLNLHRVRSVKREKKDTLFLPTAVCNLTLLIALKRGFLIRENML